MKRFGILTLALASLGLSACGLRGDLEQPPPLWGDPPPVEDATPAPQEVSELRPRIEEPLPEGSYRDAVTGEIVWIQNENGGDKPMASPAGTAILGTSELPPVQQ